MASYQKIVNADLDVLVKEIEDAVIDKKSIICKAICKMSDDYTENGVRTVIKIYERYSVTRGAWITLTLIYTGYETIKVSAVATGGGDNVYDLFNSVDENRLLGCAIDVLERYSNCDKDMVKAL